MNHYNETEQLFMYLIAFASGWATAYLFKNLGKLWRKFGPLFGIILIPWAMITLLLMFGWIQHENSLTLSITLAVGFFVRLIKRDR